MVLREANLDRAADACWYGVCHAGQGRGGPRPRTVGSVVTRSLVLARVGNRSLHPAWVQPGVHRDWDLRLVPYQEIPEQVGLDCVVTEVVPGPKWTGIREHLNRWDGWREYDYIWLPDDDLLTDQASISAMFEIARRVGLELFAPSMHDASYFTHFSAMRNHSFFGRWTGFVEILMPGFRVSALEELLPTLDLSETGWGWGLDSVWPALLGYRDVGVLDSLPMLHTRPVGRHRDADLVRRLHEESDRILARYACSQVHTTYAAFDENGKALQLDPETFFAQLVAGWQHLIDADPRVLTWLVNFQQKQLRPLTYPTEGTPGPVTRQ